MIYMQITECIYNRQVPDGRSKAGAINYRNQQDQRIKLSIVGELYN